MGSIDIRTLEDDTIDHITVSDYLSLRESDGSERNKVTFMIDEFEFSFSSNECNNLIKALEFARDRLKWF